MSETELVEEVELLRKKVDDLTSMVRDLSSLVLQSFEDEFEEEMPTGAIQGPQCMIDS